MNTNVLNGLNLDLNKTDNINNNQLVSVTENDIQEFTDNYKLELRKDSEVLALTSKINVTDPQSILTFGQESSESLSKVSDSLLHSIKAVNQEEAGEILVHLTKIMDQFNIEDFKNAKEPNFLEKMFKKVKNSVESMLNKYNTMGNEVNKIYMTLKQYENNIVKDSKYLSELYQENIKYYKILEKYIVAGELALEELDNELIPQFQEQAKCNNDSLAQQNLNVLLNCRDMVDQRITDLKTAEQVALQSLPMIQQMQLSNFNLTRTIKSSFITTIPIFKQCLIQAVMLKRQELMAKNIEEVRKTTNELLLKNAQNTANQSVKIAEMAGKSCIDINTLEESFNIIMQGIKDTKTIQEENKKQREKDSKRLDELKYEILSKKE